MTGWNQDLVNILGNVWLFAPLFYLTYLMCTFVRRVRRTRRPPFIYATSTVSFHAWWGVVLSLPGLMLAITVVSGPAWQWLGALAAIATAACWAIALAAAGGRRVSMPLAWTPLVVMVASTVGLTLASTIVIASGGEGQEVSDVSWLKALAVMMILFTDFGLGLVGWCTVTICFATSVRSLERFPRAAAWAWPPLDISPPPASDLAHKTAASYEPEIRA